MEHGEPFAAVVDMFVQDCHDAGLICGYNIHFDTGIVKANILRELGREYYDANDVETALYKGKRIDTMRSTMKWVDARTSWGKLKFPNLGELYARCFPGETFHAHDALDDTKAVARCLPVLIENGLVELKVKEYPDITEQARKTGQCAAASFDELSTVAKIAVDSAKKFGASPETAGNGPNFSSNEKDDKLPVQQEKGPQNENSAKITADVADLLEQNDF
jgi:DNA polymerase III epsilon subunit-like protein